MSRLDSEAPSPRVRPASRLTRRRLLRWAGIAGGGGLGGGLVACSDRPPTDVVESPTEPRLIQDGGTLNGTITGLLTGSPVRNAEVVVQGVGTVRADFSGRFSIRIDRPGNFRLTVSAENFLTRETGVRLTGSIDVAVTLIETDEDLTLHFLDQFARGLGPTVEGTSPRTPGMISRWLERPRVLLYRKLDGAPDETVSDLRLEDLERIINSVWLGFTGGAFGGSATFEHVDAPPPADRRQVPMGAIGFFQSADESRGAGHQARTDDRFVFANAFAFTGLEERDAIVVRVLGQALGATFVATSTPSAMNRDGRSLLTEEDQLAATVLYDRPPGNASPDIDPDDFFLNL